MLSRQEQAAFEAIRRELSRSDPEPLRELPTRATTESPSAYWWCIVAMREFHDRQTVRPGNRPDAHRNK